jgi:hypothetical protein
LSGLTGMGFTNDDIANLLLKVNGDPGAGAANQDAEPIDESAELHVKWGTEQGPAYQLVRGVRFRGFFLFCV